MNIEFRDDDLKKLAADPQFTGGYSRDVVKAFRKRMQHIMSAVDERDLRAMKGVRYEKLKGKRDGERSMRLNDQFRLILRLKSTGANKTVLILAIEDYH